MNKMRYTFVWLFVTGTWMGEAVAAERLIPVDSVLSWVETTLEEGIGEDWENEFAKMNEHVMLFSADSTEKLAAVKHLFPKLRSVATPVPPNTFLNLDRLVWEMEVYHRQLQRKNESPDVIIDLPSPEFHELVSETRVRFFGISISLVLLVVLVVLWGLKRKSAPVVEMSKAQFQEEYEWLLNALSEDPSNESLIAQVSLFNVRHDQHPLFAGSPNSIPGAEALNKSERALAALLYDGVPREVIIEQLQKSPGTFYNLRSTLRKKLGISEKEELQAAIRAFVH
jgi:DNA-binding CsgD family transcriptional regulator